jgi:hypothetical protein
METGYSHSALWAVPLWSILVLTIVAVWAGRRKRSRTVLLASSVAAFVAAVPLIPVIAATVPKEPPSQVIYRFDDHRWLELKGWDCEGALWYVDSKQSIRTEAAAQAFRISFFTYIHPSKHYISIPFNDSSGVLVSRDGGRTFENANIFVLDSGRYQGHSPTQEEILRFVVVDDRGYIETKDGRLIESSTPVGDAWGLNYIDYPAPGDEHALADYERPDFQDMKSSIPAIKDYKGWTQMRCDPNVGVVPDKDTLAKVPGVIFAAETYTVGAPVYWTLRALDRRSRTQ